MLCIIPYDAGTHMTSHRHVITCTLLWIFQTVLHTKHPHVYMTPCVASYTHTQVYTLHHNLPQHHSHCTLIPHTLYTRRRLYTLITHPFHMYITHSSHRHLTPYTPSYFMPHAHPCHRHTTLYTWLTPLRGAFPGRCSHSLHRIPSLLLPEQSSCWTSTWRVQP